MSDTCMWESKCAYLGLLVGVPGEGNGVVGNLLNVGNGVEALLVVSWSDKTKRKSKDRLRRKGINDNQIGNSKKRVIRYDDETC